MRILFITASLADGGAERFLSDLAIELKDRNYRICIVSLGTPDEKYVKKISSSGISLLTRSASKLGYVKLFFQTIRFCQIHKPTTIQGWLYKGDIWASLVQMFFPKANLFWSIRNTSLPRKNILYRIFSSFQIAKFLSNFFRPSVISCDLSALDYHVANGFVYKKSVVIGNAIPARFIASPGWRTTGNQILKIGMAARMASGKGQVELISALKIVKEESDLDFSCNLIGTGVQDNYDLKAYIEKQQLQNQIVLEQPKFDLLPWYLSLDLYVLASSYWEGFPNALLEAASLGVPCIATDIGSAKLIVGERYCVKKSDERLLASKIIEVLGNYSCAINEAQSRRSELLANYSVERILRAYLYFWTTADRLRSSK